MRFRKHKRYKLSAPVLFVWAVRSCDPQSGRGNTRDISTSGVYVMTDAPPPVGARVQMEIVLPKLTDSGPGMRLICEGVVLRCESDDERQRGFAACGQFYPETVNLIPSQLNASEKPIKVV